MTDLSFILVLVAIVLLYASLLLVIRLRSVGIAARRVYRLIAELWGTFVLIVVVFASIQRLIGPVPRSSIAGEFGAQLGRVHHLAIVQQLLIYCAMVLAIALFAHFIWSFQQMQRHAPYPITPTEGGHE